MFCSLVFWTTFYLYELEWYIYVMYCITPMYYHECIEECNKCMKDCKEVHANKYQQQNKEYNKVNTGAEKLYLSHEVINTSRI